MNALPASAEPVPLLRHLMATARAKSDDLVSQLHPAWVQAAWQRIGYDAAPAAATGPRCSAALAAVYGLRWASLAAFRQRAHRIALLPRDRLLRVLAAIGLHAERERVRRSIVRSTRLAIIERIGEPAYDELLAAPAGAPGQGGPLSVAELDLERLAAAGCAHLGARREWHCRDSLAWVRLALAPGSTPASPSPSAAVHDTESPLARLPHYFPEHAWLFGSPMDRALSA